MFETALLIAVNVLCAANGSFGGRCGLCNATGSFGDTARERVLAEIASVATSAAARGNRDGNRRQRAVVASVTSLNADESPIAGRRRGER